MMRMRGSAIQAAHTNNLPKIRHSGLGRPRRNTIPFEMSSIAPRPRFTLRRLPSRSTTFADDVRSGLGATPKSLSPRWFYDALGSALFSAITNLPEYYVTRTEESILRDHGAEIIEAIGGPVSLVEL